MAVIGVGMVGTVHAHAVQRAGGVLAAVAGSSVEISRSACEQLNATRAATAETSSTPTMSTSCTCAYQPPAPRNGAGRVGRGKHVICEEPLAAHLADAADLVEAAAKTRQVTAVPFYIALCGGARSTRADRAGSRHG